MTSAIRKTLKWSGRLLLIGFALLGAVSALGMYANRHQPYAGLMRNDEQKPITIQLGATTLSIPENYLLVFPAHYGETIQFSLLTLLPDFPGRTPENRKLMERAGWYDQVIIFLDYKGHTMTGKKLFDAMYKISNHDVQLGPNGYNEFTTGCCHFKEDLFRGAVESPKNLRSCHPEHEVHEDHGHWFPTCDRIIKAAPDTVMTYTMSRKYLPEYDRIEPQLIAFLNRFVVAGPKLEVIE